MMGPPGHFGIALAAKPLVPEVPLWTLLVASEALDLLSFGFISLGLERMAVTKIDLQHGIQTITPGSVPYSHGLLMSIIWSILFGALAYIFFRNRRTSVILGLVVFSHWILDFIVHIPDLPLYLEGSPLFGLGLWGSGPGLITSSIIEFTLLAVGLSIYFVFRKRNKQQVALE
jgi:hypothetical protein